MGTTSKSTTSKSTTSKKTVTRAPSAPAIATRRSSEEVTVAAAAPSTDAIAALAYRYFVEGGYVCGNELDHWLRAESKLRGG